MANRHQALNWLGTSYRTLLSAADSGGGMGVFESTCPPGSGPPRHIHHAEDEAICVLSGDLRIWCEGETFACGPGDLAFVPRGREHTFQVVSEHPARLLAVLTPGGFEGFFQEVSQRQCRIPEDMGQVVEIGQRFNISFTGPPLEAG